MVYVVITLETPALCTPNEVAVLVTDGPAKKRTKNLSSLKI